MLERFTRGSRKAVVLAQEEARMMRHAQVSGDHLLLALISQQDERAGQVLSRASITADAVRALMPEPDSDWPPSGHIPFSDELRHILKCSLRESLRLGHSHIGTGHLLLGIMAADGESGDTAWSGAA